MVTGLPSIIQLWNYRNWLEPLLHNVRRRGLACVVSVVFVDGVIISGTRCKITKRDSGKSYYRYYRIGSRPWFREIKLNRRAYVLINRMITDHPYLKASLSRFNIMSTAECECSDGLQNGGTYLLGLKNCTRTKRQQWWTFCLRTAKKITHSQLQSS
jgi:hypothetical protein